MLDEYQAATIVAVIIEVDVIVLLCIIWLRLLLLLLRDSEGGVCGISRRI